MAAAELDDRGRYVRRGEMRIVVSRCLSILGLISLLVMTWPLAAFAEVNPAPASQGTEARVIKKYGAPLRESPEASSTVLMVGACNQTFLVVGDNGSWKEVFQVVGRPDELTVDEDDDIFGWVSVDNIALGASTAAVDCAAAPSHRVGAMVESFTDTVVSHWPRPRRPPLGTRNAARTA